MCNSPDQLDPRYCPNCGRLGKLAYHTVRAHPGGGIVRPYCCDGCGTGWDVLVRRIVHARAARPPEHGAKGCI